MLSNARAHEEEACKFGGNVLGWRADSGRRKKEAAEGEEDESCSFARGADSGPGGFFGGYGRSSGPGVDYEELPYENGGPCDILRHDWTASGG